jgi:hypothetical protein
MYVVGLGLLLIIGSLVALGRRLMGRMVSEWTTTNFEAEKILATITDMIIQKLT